MLEIRNGSMPLLLVRCTLPSLSTVWVHSATCAADAPMSEKVSKPDTEPRRAHVTNVPEADIPYHSVSLTRGQPRLVDER